MNDADFLPILRGQIMEQGFDQATASHYAVLIGDTPTVDTAGNIVVMEGEKVLATLRPLRMFSEG